MLKFKIDVLGCKVSYYDSRKIASTLLKLGFIEVSDETTNYSSNIDLYFLHSCSVTSRASQKVRQLLSSARKRFPYAKIVLSGCEASLIKASSDKKKILQLCDAVLSVNFSEDDIRILISDLIRQNHQIELTNIHTLNDQNQQNKIYTISNQTCEIDVKAFESRTRAFIKIQDGCNQYCSYCIIPFIRGSEQSKAIYEVVNEVEKFVRNGFQEIVLTGIHLGRYQYGLANLLHKLDKIPNLRRIRLSSIEANEITPEIINWLCNSVKACHHMHIPLQSGSNKILKLMNRPYTVDEYLYKIDLIRSKVNKDFAFSTDVIVGFPSETNDDFLQTIDAIKKAKFMRLHIFRFSPRDGTKAASMQEQIPEKIKKERSQILEKIWKENSLNYLSLFVGKRVEILWEQFDGKFWYGFSREYIPCKLSVVNNYEFANLNIIKNTISNHIGIKCDENYLEVR